MSSPAVTSCLTLTRNYQPHKIFLASPIVGTSRETSSNRSPNALFVYQAAGDHVDFLVRMTRALGPLQKLSVKHIGCRSIVSKSAATAAPLVMFKYNNTGADPQFRAVYNRGITLDIVESKMVCFNARLRSAL